MTPQTARTQTTRSLRARTSRRLGAVARFAAADFPAEKRFRRERACDESRLDKYRYRI